MSSYQFNHQPLPAFKITPQPTVTHCGIMVGAPKPHLPVNFLKLSQAITPHWIATDLGLRWLADHQLTAEYAVGDFDTLTRTHQQLTNFTHRLQTPTHKDVTDFEFALEVAQRAYPNLTDLAVFAWSGGRLDQQLANLLWVLDPKWRALIAQTTLYTEHDVTRFYLPGTYAVVPQADFRYVSIITLTPVTDLTITGFKYELARSNWAYPKAFISNEWQQTAGRISFTTGIVAVTVSRD